MNPDTLQLAYSTSKQFIEEAYPDEFSLFDILWDILKDRFLQWDENEPDTWQLKFSSEISRGLGLGGGDIDEFATPRIIGALVATFDSIINNDISTSSQIDQIIESCFSKLSAPKNGLDDLKHYMIQLFEGGHIKPVTASLYFTVYRKDKGERTLLEDSVTNIRKEYYARETDFYFWVDEIRSEIHVNRKPLIKQKKVRFKLLIYLLKNIGKGCAFDDLLKRIWKQPNTDAEKINTMVHNFREEVLERDLKMNRETLETRYREISLNINFLKQIGKHGNYCIILKQ